MIDVCKVLFCNYLPTQIQLDIFLNDKAAKMWPGVSVKQKPIVAGRSVHSRPDLSFGE